MFALASAALALAALAVALRLAGTILSRGRAAPTEAGTFDGLLGDLGIGAPRDAGRAALDRAA